MRGINQSCQLGNRDKFDFSLERETKVRSGTIPKHY